MVVKFTGIGENITNFGRRTENQEFCFGHTKFEISIIPPNEYIRQAVGYKSQASGRSRPGGKFGSLCHIDSKL